MIEVRVRLEGIEVAKSLGPFGEPVAEGVYLVSAPSPVFVDVREIGGKRYRSLPYIDATEVEFGFGPDAIPEPFPSHKFLLASEALRVLIGAGVPVEGARAVSVEIEERR